MTADDAQRQYPAAWATIQAHIAAFDAEHGSALKVLNIAVLATVDAGRVLRVFALRDLTKPGVEATSLADMFTLVEFRERIDRERLNAIN